MTHYSKADYWDERYARERDQFEWYNSYFNIKDLMTQFI